MGTFLFWMTWGAVACFLKLTTARQRQRWAGLFWLFATVSIITATNLNFIRQGYLTVV